MSAILLPQLPKGTTLVDQNGVTPPFIDYLDSLTSGVQKVISTYAPVGTVTNDNANAALVYPLWSSSVSGSLVPYVSSAGMWFQPSSGTLQVIQLNSTSCNWTSGYSYGVTSFLNGQTAATFTSPQIAFGYAGTVQYEHFIHTRHDAAAGASSAIDFYTNDGTAAGVFPTNAVHNLSMVNGDIGIGTTTPPHSAGWRQLEISSTAGDVIKLTATSTGANAQWYNNSSASWIGTGNAYDFYLGVNAVNVWRIKAVDGNTVGSYGLLGKGVFEGHHVEAYGAVGDGTTDDSAAFYSAFQAALNRVNGSNMVTMSAKTYRITTQMTLDFSGGKSLVMRGSGGKVAQDSVVGATGTVIKCDFAVGYVGLIFYATDNGTMMVDIADFDIVNVNVGGGGIFFGYFGYTFATDNKNMRMHNVGVHNFNGSNIAIINGGNIVMTNVRSVVPSSGAASNQALLVYAEAGRFTGGILCKDSVFVGAGYNNQTINFNATGAGAAIRGVQWVNVTAYYGGRCMQVLADTGGTIQDFWLTACDFDGIDGLPFLQNAIWFEANGVGSSMSGLIIRDFYAVNWQNGGITVEGNGGSVANVMISGAYMGLLDAYGIFAYNVQGIKITDNSFFRIGNGVTGVGGNSVIGINGGCNQVIITGNTHTDAGAYTCAYIVYLGGTGVNDYMIVNNNTGRANIAFMLNSSGAANVSLTPNFKL